MNTSFTNGFYQLQNLSPTILAVLGVLVVIEFVLVIIALVKVLKTPANEVRGPKILWVLLTFLVSIVGPLITIFVAVMPPQIEEVVPHNASPEEANAKVADILYGSDSHVDRDDV